MASVNGKSVSDASSQTRLGDRTIRPPGKLRLERLSSTAAEMFLESGYETMSFDALIARVGGSRRNIYSHFGGREGLFLAAITSACEEVAAPLRLLEIPHSEKPAAALLLFGRKVLELVLLPRALALHRLMIAEAPRFPELAKTIWQSGHEQAAQILAVWIGDQQKAGVLKKNRPAALLARQFVDLVVADAQLRAHIGIPAHSQRDSALKEAINTFLHGQAIDAS